MSPPHPPTPPPSSIAFLINSQLPGFKFTAVRTYLYATDIIARDFVQKNVKTRRETEQQVYISHLVRWKEKRFFVFWNTFKSCWSARVAFSIPVRERTICAVRVAELLQIEKKTLRGLSIFLNYYLILYILKNYDGKKTENHKSRIVHFLFFVSYRKTSVK